MKLWAAALVLSVGVHEETRAVVVSSVKYVRSNQLANLTLAVPDKASTPVLCARACSQNPQCSQVVWDNQTLWTEKCSLILPEGDSPGGGDVSSSSLLYSPAQYRGLDIVQYSAGVYNTWKNCNTKCGAIQGKMLPIPNNMVELKHVMNIGDVFLDYVRQGGSTEFFTSDGGSAPVGEFMIWGEFQPNEKLELTTGVRSVKGNHLVDIVVNGDYADKPIICACLVRF